MSKKTNNSPKTNQQTTAANVTNETTNNIANIVGETKSTTVNFGANSNAKKGITYMFNKKNYTFMLAGLALIALGFILMAGGKSTDPHVFNAKELYSFRRITLAPVLVMAGFILEIYAIMRVPKEGEA